MSDYLSEYHPPTPKQVANLEEAERLYTMLESFIRNNLQAGGITRQQALFRLRESEMWVKEGLKGVANEPSPR